MDYQLIDNIIHIDNFTICYANTAVNKIKIIDIKSYKCITTIFMIHTGTNIYYYDAVLHQIVHYGSCSNQQGDLASHNIYYIFHGKLQKLVIHSEYTKRREIPYMPRQPDTTVLSSLWTIVKHALL